MLNQACNHSIIVSGLQQWPHGRQTYWILLSQMSLSISVKVAVLRVILCVNTEAKTSD